MTETYLVLLVGATVGLAASFIGGLILHRNRLRIHSRLHERLEQERTALQDDISEIGRDELAETDAGKELMAFSQASIRQFGYARENLSTSLKRHNLDLLRQIEEDRKKLAQSAERLGLLSELQQESAKRLENLKKENVEMRLANSLKASAAPTGSTQSEQDLRIALKEVARLQNQLAEANMRFIEAEVEGSSVFSRELQETLSATLQHIELLLNESVGILNPMQRNFLESMKAATMRLHSLIEDFAQVKTFQVDHNAHAHDLMDLNGLIQDVVAETGSQARAKRITLHVHLQENLTPVYADREVLGQILTRLLSNAAAVSPLQGTIQLRADKKAEEGREYLLLQVSDTGGGIPPEDLPRVFAPLYRAADIPARGVGDTGMGLFIAKTLTAAQNGRIWVDTESGVGSTYNVLVPIVGAASADANTNE
jgi:signal transduction histidine kinase